MAEEVKFEKAMQKLEQIVDALEAGSLSLEDALKKYEEGVRLSAVCQKKLQQAEQKIEILTKSLDGEIKKEAFDLEAAPKKTKKSAPKKRVVEDEEFLI